MRRIWLLNDLYVAQSARQCGVAAALLDAARRYAMATGAGGLMLQTEVTNVAAQAAYEHSGWIRQDGFYWYDLTT